jgi:hypothetical protein
LLAVAANDKGSPSFYQLPPGLIEILLSHSDWPGRPSADVRFIQVELDYFVLRDVLGLCRRHSLEAFSVPVDESKRMSKLIHPKVEVRNMTEKLMPVQRYEFG